MPKSYDDYFNDSRLKNEPMGLRITHAMRLKVQDDISNMTLAEETTYYHEGTLSAFSRLGISPKYTSPYREN